jgi:phosphatidylglycerophosphate synthase
MPRPGAGQAAPRLDSTGKLRYPDVRSMATKPWDSRLAHALILPLRGTRVHPNAVTTGALLTGVGAAALYAVGTPAAADAGAACWVLASILDHADGELARLTGKVSEFGHRYDRAADLIVKLSLFAGMGASLRHGPLQQWALPLGLLGGASLLGIFLLRGEMARRSGAGAFKQPVAGGFELEDILYVIAPLTWLGWLGPFLVATAIGTPLFALWCAVRLWRLPPHVETRLDHAPTAHIRPKPGMGQEAGGPSPDVRPRRG